MRMDFPAVSMFTFAFMSMFYLFSIFFFGSSMINLSSISQIKDQLGLGYNSSLVNSIIGSNWGFFQALHGVIFFLMLPFSYLYELILTIIDIFTFLFAFLTYPFSFIPTPFNFIIPLFFTILIIVSFSDYVANIVSQAV